MIILRYGFTSESTNSFIQIMSCSNCSKDLGCCGWIHNENFNEIHKKGWKYCPFCGMSLDLDRVKILKIRLE